MRTKDTNQVHQECLQQGESENFAVAEMCEALEVSRSGFYRLNRQEPSKRQLENERITQEIRDIHSHRHMCSYGSPRVTIELRKRGHETISENRVARLMQENEIVARFGKPFRPKTTQVDNHQRFSPNLVSQNSFPNHPGEIVVSDITYIPTREGWLYLAVVVDLCSRAVLGWKIHSTLETDKLVMPALNRTLETGILHPRAIFHSDRGCQYTSKPFRARLKASRMRQSMSACGYCYDNAFCESFFATLKAEAFPPTGVFETMAAAKLAIFDYIETFYNSKRLHSSLDYQCPNEILNFYFPKQHYHLN